MFSEVYFGFFSFDVVKSTSHWLKRQMDLHILDNVPFMWMVGKCTGRVKSETQDTSGFLNTPTC